MQLPETLAISHDMVTLTPLGHTTVVISWLFTALAFLSLIVSTATLLVLRTGICASEWLNFTAFVTAIVLVSQNTYAIHVEGQSEHQDNLSLSQIDTLAKVRQYKLEYILTIDLGVSLSSFTRPYGHYPTL